MSVEAKLIIDEKEINVLRFSFGFHQVADTNGRPSQKPVFVGLKLIIETRKDLNLADWSFDPNQTKQLELHIYPVVMGGKTRRIYFYDCHLINWKNDFSSTGSQPMCETLEITAAGVNNSNASTEYSAYWRETFPQQEIEPTVRQQQEEPELLNYHIEDLNNNIIEEDKIKERQEIYLVINSRNTEGEIVDIDLENKAIDFEYDEKWMKDDIIRDVILNETFTKVKLKAIKQKEN